MSESIGRKVIVLLFVCSFLNFSNVPILSNNSILSYDIDDDPPIPNLKIFLPTGDYVEGDTIEIKSGGKTIYEIYREKWGNEGYCFCLKDIAIPSYEKIFRITFGYRKAHDGACVLVKDINHFKISEITDEYIKVVFDGETLDHLFHEIWIILFYETYFKIDKKVVVSKTIDTDDWLREDGHISIEGSYEKGEPHIICTDGKEEEIDTDFQGKYITYYQKKVDHGDWIIISEEDGTFIYVVDSSQGYDINGKSSSLAYTIGDTTCGFYRYGLETWNSYPLTRGTYHSILWIKTFEETGKKGIERAKEFVNSVLTPLPKNQQPHPQLQLLLQLLHQYSLPLHQQPLLLLLPLYLRPHHSPLLHHL